jgi:hypothetical protein
MDITSSSMVSETIGRKKVECRLGCYLEGLACRSCNLQDNRITVLGDVWIGIDCIHG